MWQQYNNDTCLDDPNTPCSARGYPAYVINATTAVDVKRGLDFGKAKIDNHNLETKADSVRKTNESPSE